MKKPLFQVTIDARSAQSHRLQVTIKAAGQLLPPLLNFPVWTPGSYLVREYSRHITRFEGGNKINKHCWRLKPASKQVSYEVYAFERSVRTSYLDKNFATLVGATLLPLLPGSFEVHLLFPSHWNLAASALPLKKEGRGSWSARVRDVDQWIDSPIVAAAPGFGQLANYKVNGIPHQFAWVGMDCGRDLQELVKDCAKINQTVIKFFGGAPFEKYTTLLHFGHRLFGGLEHRDSQLSMFDGASLADKKDYHNFLRLFAHEYFHAWNVKSLRPEALGPFDYSRENYTEDLWFAEGLTDYFDEMIPHLAGMTDATTYWTTRLKSIASLADGAPAHSRRSLSESSFDAWIRHYRPDEDSVNTDVSYYVKGAQLGLCWDALLQTKSRGRWNLAKLMRSLWQNFGISAQIDLRAARPGYSRGELLAYAEKITKIKQATLIESWVTRRKPLPCREALAQLKIPFHERISDPAAFHLGAQLQAKNNALQVIKVYSGSSMEAAGVAPGDEILAIGQDRSADLDCLPLLLKKSLVHGTPIQLTVCRLNKIFMTKVKLRPHRGLGVEWEYKPK